jgi:hypothetical protein
MAKLNGCVSFYDKEGMPKNNNKYNDLQNQIDGTSKSVEAFVDEAKNIVKNTKNKNWLIWVAIAGTLLLTRGR